MTDCLFCKIVAGEIPSDKVRHEGTGVISFSDIHPVRPGHTLIVPETHYRWFWELPSDVANELFAVARSLAVKLKEDRHADYVQLSIVGKDVPHVHIHLIPRMFTETDSPLP